MKDMGLTFSPGYRPGEAPRGTVAVELPIVFGARI